VASAQRASTLHYCCNDTDFAWGPVGHDHSSDLQTQSNGVDRGRRFIPQVLLLDAGCEWNNYASDSKFQNSFGATRFLPPLTLVTRTTPVGNGGRFTKEAREIYLLVLKMQEVLASPF
jgi:Xaa-Pro dipeptidase